MAATNSTASSKTASKSVLAAPISPLLSQLEARENAWKQRVKDLENELAVVKANLTAAQDRSGRAEEELTNVKVILTAVEDRAKKLETELKNARDSLAAAQDRAKIAEAEVKKVVIGQDKLVADLVSGMKAFNDRLTANMRALVAGPNVESTSVVGQTNNLTVIESAPAATNQYNPMDCEWLLAVEPASSPYFPQLGDKLLYIKDAHRLYLEQVNRLGMTEAYAQMKKQLPYIAIPGLPGAIRCDLADVDFDSSIPGFVRLTLTGAHIKKLRPITRLSVFYRPITSTPDFLVLRNTSLHRAISPGDRIYHIPSHNCGTIASSRYLSTGAGVQIYSALLDGKGEEERVKACDIQVIGDTAFESLHRAYKGSCTKVSGKVAQIMQSVAARPFLSLREKVGERSYPVDLTLIKSRLDGGFYRRNDAVLTDVYQLRANAWATIEPANFEARKQVIFLCEVLFSVISDHDSISDADWRRLNQQEQNGNRNLASAGQPPTDSNGFKANGRLPPKVKEANSDAGNTVCRLQKRKWPLVTHGERKTLVTNAAKDGQSAKQGACGDAKSGAEIPAAKAAPKTCKMLESSTTATDNQQLRRSARRSSSIVSAGKTSAPVAAALSVPMKAKAKLAGPSTSHGATSVPSALKRSRKIDLK